MEFTYSFDLTLREPARLLAAVPGASEPLDRTSHWWRSHHGALGAELSLLDVALMSDCTMFDTRAAHVARVAARTGASTASVALAFDGLLARRLLLEPLQFLGPPQAPIEPVPEPVLALRTCNRPQLLKRLLTSLATDAARWDVRRRVLVCDDAAEPELAARNRAIAQEAGANARLIVHYFGPDERARALPQLQAQCSGAEREVLAELLTRTPGAIATGARNWNWILLLTAGGSVSMLDDDYVFPLQRMPGHAGSIDLAARSLAEARYAERVEALGLEPLDADPYAIARSVLGQSPATLVTAGGTVAPAPGTFDASELTHLRSQQRLIAASVGHHGAFGYDSTQYLSITDAASLADLWRAPYDHQRLEGECMVWALRRLRLPRQIVATPFLVDNRALTPCVGTRGRIDDGVFLALLRAVVPDAAFAMLPMSVGHFPGEVRHRLANSEGALHHYSNALLVYWLTAVANTARGRDRTLRLRAIGALTAERAGASARALADDVVALRSEAIADFAARLERTLRENPQAPAPWRAYAERMLEANLRALHGAEAGAQELAQYRASLEQLGGAVALWPRLWQHARHNPLVPELHG